MNGLARWLRALDSPPRAFIALAILFGIPILILFPPFQGPDEQRHFFRVWQITDGHILPLQIDHANRAKVPQSAVTVVSHYAGLPFNPEAKTTAAQIWRDLGEPLDADARSVVDNPSGVYAPIGYAGHIVGVLLGRLLNLPIVAIVYLSRLIGFALAVAIIALALARAVAFRRVLFMIACLPMAFAQLVVINIDGQLFAWSFFLFAELTRALYDDSVSLHRRFLLGLTGAAVLVTLSKPVYLAPLLLLLAMPVKRAGGRKRLIGAFAGILVLSALVEKLWLVAVNDALAAAAGPSSGTAGGLTQQDLVFAQPLHFLFVMVRNFSVKGFWYLETFIGQAGWLDVHLPPPAIFILFFTLTLACLTADVPRPVTAWLRALAAIAFFAATTTLSYVMYLTYTALGSPYIEGLQGRYFVPLVPTAAVVLATSRLRIDASPKATWRAIYGYCAAASALLVYAVADRYYGL